MRRAIEIVKENLKKNQIKDIKIGLFELISLINSLSNRYNFDSHDWHDIYQWIVSKQFKNVA